MFEADTAQDDIVNRYSEAEIQEQQLQASQKKDIDDIVNEYPEVITNEPGLTSLLEFALEIGDTQPIFQRAYYIPAAFRKSIDEEIDWLLTKHYIRVSTSPWSSPMVTVRKPDSNARLCVDFKKINSVTRQDSFYMPPVEEVLEGVGKASIISNLDLTKGYYHIRMSESDICKTAFICYRGKYELMRKPLGVKNAPAVFQELMQSVFSSHNKFCTLYMDDIVYSDSWSDHLPHIKIVLKKLREEGPQEVQVGRDIYGIFRTSSGWRMHVHACTQSAGSKSIQHANYQEGFACISGSYRLLP